MSSGCTQYACVVCTRMCVYVYVYVGMLHKVTDKVHNTEWPSIPIVLTGDVNISLLVNFPTL